MRFLLKRRLAIISTASQRPGIARRAVAARILPGASRALVERTRRSWRPAQQVLDLHRRDEKRVAILLEPAATAAQRALSRPQASHFAIELFVKLTKLGAPIEASSGCDRSVEGSISVILVPGN